MLDSLSIGNGGLSFVPITAKCLTSLTDDDGDDDDNMDSKE